MSVILVATFKGKSWVIDNADGDKDWEFQAAEHISNPESRYTTDRAKALLIAHNVQHKKPSARGVWEVRLSDPKPKPDPKPNHTPKSTAKRRGRESTRQNTDRSQRFSPVSFL